MFIIEQFLCVRNMGHLAGSSASRSVTKFEMVISQTWQKGFIYKFIHLFVESFQHGSLLHQSLSAEKIIEDTSNVELTVSWNLVVEVTSHHFCCILFVRKKSLYPACTQGKDINTPIKRHKYPEARIVGSHVRGGLLHSSFSP